MASKCLASVSAEAISVLLPGDIEPHPDLGPTLRRPRYLNGGRELGNERKPEPEATGPGVRTHADAVVRDHDVESALLHRAVDADVTRVASAIGVQNGVPDGLSDRQLHARGVRAAGG